jgi:hypothetical protein
MGPRFRGDDGVYGFHLYVWAAGPSTLGASGQGELPTISPLGIVLIWAVTPASSRHWSRQDGGATPKLGQHAPPRHSLRNIHNHHPR